GNPTIEAVEKKLALLESLGGDTDCHAVLTSSGMSAISTLIQALLPHGKGVLIHPSLYGGTLEYFFSELPKSGHKIFQADFRNETELNNSLEKYGEEIGLVYFETPTNPGLEIIDISNVSRLAKRYEIPTVVDNTFCTSYIQRPLQLGADYVIYSTTKFINGHGTSIGGAIIGKNEEVMRNRVWKTMKLMGTCISPFEAWLINQGIKTLPLRMEKQTENASQLAKHLAKFPDKVRVVHYPGLEHHSGFDLGKKQMSLPGSMLSFELIANLKKSVAFCNRLAYSKAPTLGDTDTLLLHPATSSHINVDPKIREETGITDGLIRLSVGLEDIDDLIEEMNAALKLLI
nr:aminotransferase class I/II-fold pyridoxal phosphate-dependent enzyme [Saprospiraceae bacterium]